jgi:hypothetical protein
MTMLTPSLLRERFDARESALYLGNENAPIVPVTA